MMVRLHMPSPIGPFLEYVLLRPGNKYLPTLNVIEKCVSSSEEYTAQSDGGTAIPIAKGRGIVPLDKGNIK